MMQEIVHTEILKFLDKEIIYPIFGSQWVSHIHMVSKKSGFTMVKNENKELVQTLLAQRPIALVLMMINSFSYSTNDLVFSKSQIYVKILVGV